MLGQAQARPLIAIKDNTPIRVSRYRRLGYIHINIRHDCSNHTYYIYIHIYIFNWLSLFGQHNNTEYVLFFTSAQQYALDWIGAVFMKMYRKNILRFVHEISYMFGYYQHSSFSKFERTMYVNALLVWLK